MTERIRLTDRQCRIYVRDMKEFGYPFITFESIRNMADDYANGNDITGNAVGLILTKEIERAVEDAKQ